MSIYGEKIFSPQIVNFEPVTESEALAIALECLVLNEEDDEEIEDEFEEIQEGANIDSFKAYREALKKYKAAIKSSKKAYKAKDFSTAKADAKKALNILKDAKKEVKSFESTKGSVAFGIALEALQVAVAATLPVVGGLAGMYGGAYGWATFATMKDTKNVKKATKAVADTYKSMGLDVDKSIIKSSNKLGKEVAKASNKAIAKEAIKDAKKEVMPFAVIMSILNGLIQLISDIIKLKKQAANTDNKADKANFFKANILSALDRLSNYVSMYISKIDDRM